MNHAPTRTFVATGLAALVLGVCVIALQGCDQKDDPKQVQAATPASPKREPTEARVLERARARWDAMAKGDWIQVYDFCAPEYKKSVSLSSFLPGKEKHKYENPVVDGLLKFDATKHEALVRSHVLWTPQHAELKRVKLEPGQTLTQEVPMVETWRWAKDDWVFVEQKGTDKFFEEHPELLRDDKFGDAKATAPADQLPPKSPAAPANAQNAPK